MTGQDNNPALSYYLQLIFCNIYLVHLLKCTTFALVLM